MPVLKVKTCNGWEEIGGTTSAHDNLQLYDVVSNIESVDINVAQSNCQLNIILSSETYKDFSNITVVLSSENGNQSAMSDAAGVVNGLYSEGEFTLSLQSDIDNFDPTQILISCTYQIDLNKVLHDYVLHVDIDNVDDGNSDITGSVIVDKTLSIDGAAADAKVVGDTIQEISNQYTHTLRFNGQLLEENEKIQARKNIDASSINDIYDMDILQTSITWDGTTTGKDTFKFDNISFFKVSDEVPDFNSIIKVKTISNDNSLVNNELLKGAGCYFAGNVIVVTDADNECSIEIDSLIDEFVAPSNGIYFPYGDIFVTSLDIYSRNINGVYLNDDFVVKISENGSIITENSEGTVTEMVTINKLDEALEEMRFTSYPIIETTATALEPEQYYVLGTVDSININLQEINDGYTHEYCFEFTAADEFYGMSINPEPKWVDKPSIESNKTYQVSILRGIGVIIGA